MAKKLKVYQFALYAVSYGNGIKLVAAFDKKQACQLAKWPEGSCHEGEWRLEKERKDVATLKKKPHVMLSMAYIE